MASSLPVRSATSFSAQRPAFARLFLGCSLIVAGIFSLPAAIGEEKGSRASTSAPANPLDTLAGQLEPVWSVLQGRASEFDWQLSGQIEIDGQPQPIEGRLRRYDDQAFDLQVSHPDYAVEIRRRGDATAFALPKHQVVFLGRGEVDAEDHLAPAAAANRLISSATTVAPIFQMVTAGNAASSLRLASALVSLQYSAANDQWTIDDKGKLKVQASGEGMKLVASLDKTQLSLQMQSSAGQQVPAVDQWPGYRVETLSRAELERTLARGVRRALEVLQPGSELTAFEQTPRDVPGGQLRYVEGQRLVILQGTPEQIGTAHGALLPLESQRCIDSVLYAFGTVQTIANGRWFRHDLEDAYKRLRPFIPEQHLVETRAMAAALGQDVQLIESLNVFPELFHCSGFAVFGSATSGGKLYHGRVLDYMTTIGLQDCATTFIVSVDGKIPFANIGYAAFIGSVSGMNDRGISLGEMGGRGEGKWDGVPMATLMRRALEECDSLEEVQDLWRSSPRTCEYYYVFADGKTNQAVGVAATPEKVEFVLPGQANPLLGEGIPDSVVLSAGSRLETLRQRVLENHGKIDVEKAIWLMSRPVAMNSNLHNVLFVPADGVFYVANADHSRPAADCKYVRYDLRSFLRPAAAVSAVPSPTAKNQ